MTPEREEAIIKAFVVPGKRTQYLARLRSSKTRQKFMNAHLFHMHDLDERYARQLPGGQRNAANVLRLLRELGAGDRCYVISASSDYDGREVDLKLAVDDIFDGGADGTLIGCQPDGLGYFQGEEPRQGYILERT
jgi:hypothetical protein